MPFGGGRRHAGTGDVDRKSHVVQNVFNRHIRIMAVEIHLAGPGVHAHDRFIGDHHTDAARPETGRLAAAFAGQLTGTGKIIQFFYKFALFVLHERNASRHERRHITSAATA